MKHAILTQSKISLHKCLVPDRFMSLHNLKFNEINMFFNAWGFMS